MPNSTAQDERRALADELEQIEEAGCSWEALGMVASDKLPLIIAALRAEPARGEEEMRERAAKVVEAFPDTLLHFGAETDMSVPAVRVPATRLAIAAAIRALPASHEGGGE